MTLLERPIARPARSRGTQSEEPRYVPLVQSSARVHARNARISLVAFSINIAIVIGLFAQQGGLNISSFQELWTAIGRISALLGTNLLLVQMLLMSRAPWIEQHYGLDRLTLWHRKLGHAAFDLIIVHVGFIILGYSGMTNRSFWQEAVSMSLSSKSMLMAVVSTALLVLIVVTSIRIAKAKLRRETWFFIHLYAYASVALAVPHQTTSGTDFIGHLPTQLYWGACYSFVVTAVVLFRIWLPLRSLLHHDLRVDTVMLENDDTVSITVRGRYLDQLQAQSGQFFIWRFMCCGQWYQAHPYSLSAAPRSNTLRLTVKALGDGSADLRNVPLGTRVMAEGPFGVFTATKRTRRKVLLIAGGVGVTPTRALLESIPARRGDITFIYRIRDERDAVHYYELQELALRRRANFHLVVGSRQDYPSHQQPLSVRHLLQLVPDIEDHGVYVCGPTGMTNTVLDSLTELGLEGDQIHYESFEM